MEIKDLVVVEIASVLAGPSVGMFFAELGAKVIKIEPKPHGGDVTRSWKLPNEDKQAKVSAYFAAVNYRKTYHFLDFNVEADYDKTLAFILKADILITNFKFGDAFKFKLDYDRIKTINPNLIYGAISGFGDESDRVAYDLILQAETGFMSMNGSPESGPVKMPVALIDVLAGHQLKQGILLALLGRGQKGGTRVSVSLYDAAISALANQASNYLMAGHVAKPIGSLHPNIAPYGEIFETKDKRKITFAIGSQKQFGALADLLKLGSLIEKPEFRDNSSRVQNRTKLKTLLETELSGLLLVDILTYCHEHYVPVAEIKDVKKVFENPAAKACVLEELIDDSLTKRVKTVAFSIRK